MINKKNNSVYNIETIDSLEELKKIKNDWVRLFNLNKNIPIFLSFEIFYLYYETIIKNYKNIKIKIFVVKNENKKIIGIFPFTLETKIYPPFLPLKELKIKDEYLIGFYNFLADPEEKQEIMFQKFLKYIKKIKSKWDIIKLNSIDKNDELFKVFALIFNHYYKTEVTNTETLVVNLNIEFDEYIKKNMKAKDHREIRRKIRRLEEKGEVKIVEIRKEQEIRKGLTFFYDIEDSGWKGKKGTSLKRSYYGGYYKKLAYHFSRENNFCLYLLQVDSKYIAGVYAIIDRGTIYFIKIGYLEDFSRYSPSNILFYLVLKELFKDGNIKKIDFYGGYQHYQKIFGKKTRIKHSITIYNKRVLPYVYFCFLKLLKSYIKLSPEKPLDERIYIKILKRFNLGRKN